MTYPKPSNSSFRYSIARLKPLANVKVWGSVGIMGLVILVLWQYSRHPEWLGNDQTTAPITGEFEGEIGNNVDIGVNVQDLEETRLNESELSPQGSELQRNPLDQPFPSAQGEQPIFDNNGNNADGNNPNLNQSNPSIDFQPLMPNVKNLDSLFPPLTPSKDSGKPIKLPDSQIDQGRIPQENALKNAMEEVFSENSSSINPSNLSPQENRQSTNKPTRPNYPISVTQPRNNSASTQNPYTYSSPQPYSQPYGDGRAPAPIPTYPSSTQFPNSYNNGNSNYPTQNNQRPRQPNYGIQPPQVDEYGY
ncbi:hypothetical protein cce_3956 [Crocosphaera subtropica ATCC 51142]|uniref:Uncharacterized protein n=1 Tax=Crocosphaera subtropica (strain ATCC 51142 / BH68) TaxID=43989 RepID=B1WPY9_CROS5|nr:hypothetical protein [Crocosphaera subtropica]ACB53304.1 hypothetical protein cce_3956 [Crocosphaera subtropica ATCC 51142]